MDPNPYAPPTAIDPIPASSFAKALRHALVIAILTPLPALGGVVGFLLGLAIWTQILWVQGQPTDSFSPLGFGLTLFAAAVCGVGTAILALKTGLWLLDREEPSSSQLGA